MSCKECETKQDSGLTTYYRWKTANIAMCGCAVHLREVFDALNSHADLLDACKWLEGAMDKDSYIWCAIREHDGCKEWVKAFRAAIAKATS